MINIRLFWINQIHERGVSSKIISGCERLLLAFQFRKLLALHPNVCNTSDYTALRNVFISSSYVIRCHVRMAHLYVHACVWVPACVICLRRLSAEEEEGGEEMWLKHLVWETEKAEDNLTAALRGASESVNSRGSVYCDSVVLLQKTM